MCVTEKYVVYEVDIFIKIKVFFILKSGCNESRKTLSFFEMRARDWQLLNWNNICS
jgi:hypothetical protein